jgi:hypothetical protein
MLTSASSEKRETRPRSNIVAPGLRYTALHRRFRLRPAVFLRTCSDLLHQFGPRSQIRGLLGGVRDRGPNTCVALRLVHILPHTKRERLQHVRISRGSSIEGYAVLRPSARHFAPASRLVIVLGRHSRRFYQCYTGRVSGSGRNARSSRFHSACL